MQSSKLFEKLAREEQTDASAHAYIMFFMVPKVKIYSGGLVLAYNQPQANPPVFNELYALPKIYSTNRFASMLEFVEENDSVNPVGKR